MDAREIALDVSKIPSDLQVIRVGEKDKNGTVLTVYVLDHGVPLNIGDLSATLLMKFSDEEMYQFSGTVDGSAAAFTIDATNMKSGYTNNAYVSLSGEDFILSTARFPVEVLASAERS